MGGGDAGAAVESSATGALMEGVIRAMLITKVKISATLLAIVVVAGIGGGVWWNNLERIFLAIDDLGCRELLE